MAIWAFILCAILTLSLIFIASFAIVFNFQQIRCHGDKKIVCWADWECNEPSGSNESIYPFVTYFISYSNACLFGKGPDVCTCDALGYDEAAGKTFNPYNTTESSPKPIYSSPGQNICGDNYPNGLMSKN